jgi:predicted lipoprotein
MNMKRYLRYILGILAIVLVLFFSLDLQKLDEHRASQGTDVFDANDYALELWEHQIPEALSRAPELGSLVNMLATDPGGAFESMGRKLGISGTWYFLTRGQGMVESVEEEFLWVLVDHRIRIQLATAFIFGNAIRDGSGVTDIDEFVNMTDFNQVSIALNRKVKEEVVPELKKLAGPGTTLEFAGAFEIREDQVDINSIRVIPVSFRLIDDR